MKRTAVISIILISAFVLITPCFAQGLKLEVGPKVGINLASFKGADADQLESFQGKGPGIIGGVASGINAKLKFAGGINIQVEVIYSMKGGEWEFSEAWYDTATSTRTQLIRMNYIEIPVLLNYELPLKGNLIPYLYAGPAVAFNVSNEAKFEMEAVMDGKKVFYQDWYEDNIYNAKGTIYEAIVGVGLNIKLGKNSLALEARYKHGFGTVFDDVPDPDIIPDDSAAFIQMNGEGIELEHKIFTFSIGYNFTFGL